MATVAELVAHLRADSSEYTAALTEAKAQNQELSASTSTMSNVGKAAFLGLGVAAVGFAAVSIKAAMDYEKVHATLVQAIKNSGSSWDAQGEAVERTDSKMRNLGFTDSDTEAGLAKLVNVTKSTTTATGLMGLAADIARGRHIELSAATDILVKVEAGRVGLLGRLGIQTKDATGATISQEEAIKRLTALYGGQAQAYTHTFSGEMEVLGAQAEHIAVVVGEALIPVLQSLMGIIASTVGFFESNKAAAIALAAVIGGPLVVAMGIWIAEMAVAAAGAIASMFETVAIAALLAASGIATAATAAASFVVAIAPLAIAIAAVVAVGYGLHELFGGGDMLASMKKGEDAGKTWGKALVDAANSTKTPLESLKNELKSVTAQQQHNLDDMKQQGSSFDEATKMAGRYAAAEKVLKEEIAHQSAEAKAQLAVTNSVAKSMGVTIPGAAKMSADALKEVQAGVKASVAAFGSWATQGALDVGITGQALGALAKQASQFGTDVAASWMNFVGQIATHDFSQPIKQQSAVSESDMEAFFVDSAAKANEWQGDLKHLIDSGVSPSFVAMFAKAGPAADQNLKAVDAMVDLHGKTWVDTIMQSGDAQRAQMQAEYAGETVDLAIAQAERVAVYKAAQDLVINGNEQGMENLKNSTNTQLAGMAADVLTQYHQAAANATGQINSVPTDHTTTFNADIQPLLDGIASAEGALSQYVSDAGTAGTLARAAMVGLNQGSDLLKQKAVGDYIASQQHGARGLVAMAGGGVAGHIVNGPTMALIGEAGREAVLPLTRYGDMVSTIKNTGMAAQVAAAANAAGGGVGHGGGGITIGAVHLDVSGMTPGQAHSVGQAFTSGMVSGVGLRKISTTVRVV